MPKRFVFKAAAAAALCLAVIFPAFPHGLDHVQRVQDALERTPVAAAPGAPIETVTGEVRHVTIEDRVVGLTVQHYALKLDDGTAVALKNVDRQGLSTGDRIVVTGQRNGKALFATGTRTLRARASEAISRKLSVKLDGTLRLLHADYFEDGRSDFVYEVDDPTGKAKRLDFAALPEALQPGMQVEVTGTVAADGFTVLPDIVAIDSLAADRAATDKGIAKAVRTNNVLVILMTFTDSAATPFTQAQVQATMAGGPGTGSVSEFFKEASFGQQLLNVTVTSWLATGSATPANCDWATMGQIGRNAATAAGYNLANYQNLVYVFPQVSTCGWAGLGYIGASGVWVNGRNQTSVYGHELGHNLGLLHAGSLRCTGVSIGGSCSVSEYGDPFDTMGNTSSMHYNAAQKADLGWIAGANVQTHTSGTKTYTLSPLETAGGTTYAVKIPAAANRTYWLEYRQPIGFDSGMSSYPNNGAQIRVASPFETICSGCDVWANDTELIDATPGTSTFTDAALTVGNTFTDSQYNITISVSSATSAALTVQVKSPGAGGTASAAGPNSDFDGNRRADIVWQQGATGSAELWMMNGPTLVSTKGFGGGTRWSVAGTGDFDGDGSADLVWRDSITGTIQLWLMTGTTIKAWANVGVRAGWSALVGDFNGDGKADLLWWQQSTGTVEIWFMNGTAVTSVSRFGVGTSWVPVAAADFDGDGRADVLWRNSASGVVQMWLMNGSTVVAWANIGSGLDWTIAGVGDFDGDGKADVLWRKTSTGYVEMWLMNGSTALSAVALGGTTRWTVAGTGDFDGDGRWDILWRDNSTAIVQMWLMNGASLRSWANIGGGSDWTIAAPK